ncbi:MAG: alkaline phosphatase [Acetobacteraceae bacterium]|nr:alkaline phosphatase [Acetobacteraceae bacterium]MSP28970.1 alkaline phosphatase [Acetobacteraceae bacterium]
MLRRRGLLRAAPALLVTARAGIGVAQPGAQLFALGVASGDPVPDGFVIWTRLAPDPLAGGGMPDQPVSVRWEVAEDAGFARIVARGEAMALPDAVHSVHVEVGGLRPGAWYWYRFVAGGQASDVGRARTAPAAGEMAARLRLILASCQNWQHGYFGAWRHAAAEEADAICFVGDYIYEHGKPGRQILEGRVHIGGECRTLAEYRARYAQYKTDPDLQLAHCAAPWIVTWDDHEVENDYAADMPGLRAEQPGFLARRAAAYRAFWEHMPLRAAQRPVGPDAVIYRRLDFGRLARLHVVDDRQYRSWQACPRPELGAGSATVGPDCTERLRPDRSMLGMAQERWLEDGLAGSTARWNVLIQQSLFAEFRQGVSDQRRWWTDAWDGYPAARQRLIDFIASRKTANPVILGGDVHCFYGTDIKTDFADPKAPVVASEFIGSSISSYGWNNAQLQPLLGANPHIRFADAERRGYAMLELGTAETAVRFRAVRDATAADSPVATLRRFALEAGRAGLQITG